jgi:hypothetical protein
VRIPRYLAEAVDLWVSRAQTKEGAASEATALACWPQRGERPTVI